MSQRQNWRLAIVLIFSLFVSLTARAQESYSFAIVPQQSASKIASLWGPILLYLESTTGYHFRLVVDKSIPHFQNGLSEGEYDFAYMNPYHYVVYHEKNGYTALVKARDRYIKGILVVAKNSSLQTVQDLKGKSVVFPSPAAFAATLLTRGYLAQQDISINSIYAGSHDAVYLDVARGLYPAGGGILRTLDSMPENIRSKLRVLWISKPYTPHPIAVSPKVPKAVAVSVRDSLIELNKSKKGRRYLHRLHITGWVRASDKDWDDVRGLHLTVLK